MNWRYDHHLAGLSILVLSGCFSEWPPYASEAEQHFDQVRPVLDALSEQLRADSLIQVEVLPAVEGLPLVARGRASFDEIPRPLVGEEAQPYLDILDGSGLVGGYKTERGVHVLLSVVDRDIRGYRYRWDYVQLDGDSLPVCGSRPTVDCGGCSIAMSDAWHLVWQWRKLNADGDPACGIGIRLKAPTNKALQLTLDPSPAFAAAKAAAASRAAELGR